MNHEELDLIFEQYLLEEKSKYPSLLREGYIPTTEVTQALEAKLISIVEARLEIGSNKLERFSKTVLSVWYEFVKIVRKRVFVECKTNDFFINVMEIDYLCLDAIASLQLGSYLPWIDLELACSLGDLLCEIYENLLGYIDKRMGELDNYKDDALKSALLKKEILDTLRVRAFRHKNCCNHFLDMICLQNAFTVAPNTSYQDIISPLKERNVRIAKVDGSDIYIVLSPDLLDDEKLSERFCVSSVNTTRVIYSELLLVFNKCSGFQDYLSKNEIKCSSIPQEHVVSKLAMISEPEVLTVVTKSVIELRQLNTEFKEIDGLSVWAGFRGLTLVDRPHTFIDYRERIYESVSKICNKLVNVNLLVGREDILALDENQLRSELDRSIFVAANFVFEFLLEVPLEYPYVQETFEIYVSPSFFWLLTYLEGFINGEYYWSSFYLVQCLEFLNPLMALEAYHHPEYFKSGIQPFKEALQRFAKVTPPKDFINKHSYIVDLGRSYVAKMEGVERKIRKAPPSIRFPDQNLLESKNYWVLSSFGSSKKFLYKCLDQRSRKLVIIKRILKSKTQKQSMKKGELGTLMTMQHINIVRYMDYFEDDEHWFMVMEFCEDKITPHSDAAGKLKLTDWDLRNIGRQILNGLVYLHTNHIVHRDIKPGNLLKDGRGFVKIADFGEAQMTPQHGDNEKFDLSSLMGTPAYMAPECLHKANVYPSADVWSFGCVLVYLMSGKHPWSHCTNDYNILYNIATTTEYPVDLDSLVCSDEWMRIIKACLQRDPAARPTAAHLLNDEMFFDVPESII